MKFMSIFDLPNVEFYATHCLCLYKHSATDFHSAYQFGCAKANIAKIQPLSYIPTNETFDGNVYKFRERKHHTNMLLWLKKNWLQCTFDHQTLSVPTNGLLLVPKNSIYKATEPKSTNYIFAEFDLFDTNGEEIFLGKHPTLLFESCPELLQQYFNNLYNAFAGIEAKSAMYCNTILYQLILNIAAEKSITPKAKTEQSILQVIAYLRRHYFETVSIKELCKISLLSSTLLRENFKKYTGCTMVEFKNKLRVENAKIQLLKTNLPVKVIAAQLGFENVFYFSKVFKQFTGVSPSEFKALHKEKT